MQQKKIIFLFALSFVQCLIAYAGDSLIFINDLVFRDAFEREAIIHCNRENSHSVTDLLYVPYTKEPKLIIDSVQQRIANCVEYLNKTIENKTETKKIKIIYDFVHKTFFSLFQLQNSFCDIFSTGEFNCVSATALYAIILTDLGIPYQIKEIPSHVYLVAYPATSKIIVESTAPEKGYYQYSDEYKYNYINGLVNTKIIRKEEAERGNIDALFDKYFFSSENISLLQLAACQYSNFGIYHFEKKEYAQALDNFKKACYIFPSERNKLSLKLILYQVLESCHFSTVSEVQNLAILCRYAVDSLDNINQEYIQTQFYRVLNTQLIEKGNYERADSSFNLVYASIPDDKLKSQIAFGYHYERSRLAILHPRDSASELYHMQAAYDINPGNENLKGFILASCFRFVEKASSPQKIMELIGRYNTRFNFLDSNEYLNGVKANCLLEMSYRSFCLNNTTEADSLLKEFEKLYARQTNLQLDQKYVEKTYMTAAGIYFRKGNYSRSRQYVQSGLIYAPGSFGLNQMLKQH